MYRWLPVWPCLKLYASGARDGPRIGVVRLGGYRRHAGGVGGVFLAASRQVVRHRHRLAAAQSVGVRRRIGVAAGQVQCLGVCAGSGMDGDQRLRHHAHAEVAERAATALVRRVRCVGFGAEPVHGLLMACCNPARASHWQSCKTVWRFVRCRTPRRAPRWGPSPGLRPSRRGPARFGRSTGRPW